MPMKRLSRILLPALLLALAIPLCAVEAAGGEFRYSGGELNCISGVDYLQRYRLYKAAENGQSGAENGEEDAEASADSGETGKSNPVTKVAGDIGETIDEIMDIIPLGFLIGGAVGVVLITGAGG